MKGAREVLKRIAFAGGGGTLPILLWGIYYWATMVFLQECAFLMPHLLLCFLWIL